MRNKLREAQNKILNVFAKKAKKFALAGGTALEFYYLHHRFSVDLDFFSLDYDLKEIDALISEFKKSAYKKLKLESEFFAANKAKVRFYTVPIIGCKRPLKIDFVEDVVLKKPKIIKIDGVRVYSVQDIYMMKLFAITGTNLGIDDIGRDIVTGRKEFRDVFDIYMLSQKVESLSVFLQKAPAQIQRGMIHWYRTFSRQDCKLALLDLHIYDNKFNAKDMIVYLEKEIEAFIKRLVIE